MEDSQDDLSPEDFAAWLNRRIGEEVTRRRLERGKSAYEMAQEVGLTDQGLRNIELARMKRGCCAVSLANITRYFGVRISEFYSELEKRDD